MIEQTNQQIKDVLKKVLKQKKMTYEELALKLECSVPTVARILGPEELSLRRLLQICEILDIEFSQLSSMIEQLQSESQKFTDEQEQFLAKNPQFFAFLMKLYSDKTPSQIASEFNLTPRSVDKYLTQLEKNELIVVTGKNKVKPSLKKVPVLGRGKLGKLYFKHLIKSSSDFFTEIIQQEEQKILPLLEPQQKKSIQYGLAGLKLTKNSYEKFRTQLTQVYENLEQQSIIEEKMNEADQLNQVVFLNAHCCLENNHPSLKIIESIFGDIPNL